MIIVRIWEGLGNQMFQYAFARAVSLASKQKVFLDIRETGERRDEQNRTPRKYGLDNFRITLPICTNVRHFYPFINRSDQFLDLLNSLLVIKVLPYKFFREETVKYKKELLDLRGNWYLQGWFQNSRYFQKYEDVIRREFVPKRKIRISSKLRHILQTENTVAVHIRRGDYTQELNALPVSYYVNALNHMRDIVSEPFWILFSDESDWVRKNLDFGERCHDVSGKEQLEDYEELFVMSCCKNNIIANSTFSWWGAWLNRNVDKRVIAPETWFLKGIRGSGKNILPADWICEPIK